MDRRRAVPICLVTKLLDLISKGQTDVLSLTSAYAEDHDFVLYPAQEEALLAIADELHVVVNTPTGSGKSLVAMAAHLKSVSKGKRSFYTAPIKALVAEKFFALSAELGKERVGLMTGDGAINSDAPIICCTAEVLANLSLEEGPSFSIDTVVMDEFHYYGDKERGVAWQLPLLTLPKTQFILMSATLGSLQAIVDALALRSGRTVHFIQTLDRPVPLHYEYLETPLHENVLTLVKEDKAPIYLVHFSQRAAAETAQELLSLDLTSKERKQKIKDAIREVPFNTAFGKELKRWISAGIGVHHAGLLPRYRLAVEKLAQAGLLTVICGTDTLGVGINVPIRSVLFSQLCKYDGNKTAILKVRDFHQIGGRAGRRGFDTAGYVYAQAPEHVAQNRILQGKALNDPKKLKKMVLKKAPEKGYAHWDQNTFQKLIDAPPEKLESQFQINHGTLLSLITGAERCNVDARFIIRNVLSACHETRTQKYRLAKQVVRMTRDLIHANVLVRTVLNGKPWLRLREDLGQDFSLHQTLSLFALHLIDSLDRESDTYALDVVSVIEAIVEDPEGLLMRQLDEVKRKAIAGMKADGLSFDERMAELDRIEVEVPLKAEIESEFASYREKFPWVQSRDLRPKALLRPMIEQGFTFNGYIKELNAARSEGLLLRYLSDVYRTLLATVPTEKSTIELDELIDWIGTTIRQTDSSLLMEWAQLGEATKLKAEDIAPVSKAADGEAIVRRMAVAVLSTLAQNRTARLAELTHLNMDDLMEVLNPLYDSVEGIVHGAEARSKKYVSLITTGDGFSAKIHLLAADGPTPFALNFGFERTIDPESPETLEFRISSFQLVAV